MSGLLEVDTSAGPHIAVTLGDGIGYWFTLSDTPPGFASTLTPTRRRVMRALLEGAIDTLDNGATP